jgi:hypothetical protein
MDLPERLEGAKAVFWGDPRVPSNVQVVVWFAGILLGTLASVAVLALFDALP